MVEKQARGIGGFVLLTFLTLTMLVTWIRRVWSTTTMPTIPTGSPPIVCIASLK